MAFKPSRDAFGSLPTEELVRAVGVGTMSYRLDNDDLPFVDDSVNDPMIAPVGGVAPLQFKAQRPAYPSGLLGKGTVDELHRGCGHLFRQPLECPFGGTGPFDRPGGPLSRTHRFLMAASA